MKKILDEIKSARDLHFLDLAAQKQLCEELRAEVINDVAKTGGHLASNLGVVELTVALHHVFDTPYDKIIFDVGHQTYIHKILTGRRDKMATLRQFKGLSGFPKTSESEYDVFNTGHSGTSISAALGLARARDIMHDNYQVVALIGDGALTSGMALEALNDAGSSDTSLIVILNDNAMSIDKNTGGMASLLSKLRTKRFYRNSNRRIKKVVSYVPFLGKIIIKIVRRLKHSIKQLILPNMYFEDIGFKYLGPVDGHDLESLEAMLERAKDLKGPILVHVKTIKGKGYSFAEDNPDKFHGISPFDPESGEVLKNSAKDFSACFSDSLCKIALNNPRVVAITAAMASGVGLSAFKDRFNNRFFDVEIAEQHAVTMAAGLAMGNMIPVCAIYSSFMQRGFDQIIHDVAMQDLHVVFCLDRAGLVGADGATHQGIFDLSYGRLIPHLKILAPKNFRDLSLMLEYAIEDYLGPVMLRYPRGGEEHFEDHLSDQEFKEHLKKNQAEVYETGSDLSLVSIGTMFGTCLKVKDILENDLKIKCEVIDVLSLKPLDRDTLLTSFSKTKKVATFEDGTLLGGLYDAVLEAAQSLDDVKVLGFGYDDLYIEHGDVTKLRKSLGLDPVSIAKKIKEEFYA